MTNLDKIRKMSVEELAEKLKDKGKCAFCIWDDCTCGGIVCKSGMTSWLNQESNPIPELKEGDIFHTKSNQYVALDDIWVVCPMRRERICISDIEGDIITIYRINSNGHYHEIWRADNE